ncbi:MAG: DedA family protein [Methylococcales bacterium]|jgi:membrane protein YqaA with SNARE-associated domain|nr:DedA family protein [Methylococcales bacterium]
MTVLSEDILELAILFFISFFSATILPGGSEAYFSFLSISTNHYAITLIIIATIANTLGGMTNYWIGLLAKKPLSQQKYFRQFILSQQNKHNTIEKANTLIHKKGYYALLLGWVPVIGDILCFVAGLYQLKWLQTLVFIGAGKCFRYCALFYLIQ